MKSGSTILKLVLVGVLGAAVMIGCSDDNVSGPQTEYNEDGCRDVPDEETGGYMYVCDGPGATDPVGEDETTTTSENPTTTVEETTTTTTVPQTTTTVKANKPISTTTRPPSTPAPTLAATTTVPPTTQAPTTMPTTQAPTTAPPVTLPPVNVSFMWSGSDTGCNVPYNTFDLMVDVMGATSAGTIIVSVNGQTVSSYGGATFNVGDTMYILFDQWPSLANGSYPVTITASSATQGPTTRTTSVTYNCPP